MKVVKTLNLNTLAVGPGGDSMKLPIVVHDDLKIVVGKLIERKTRCIALFHNISDYKYSTKSTDYTTISPVDAVGYIDGIDWETGDIILEIDEKYGTPSDVNYISPEELALYELAIRAKFINATRRDYPTIGDTTRVAVMTEIIGFDLVKLKEK